MPSHNALRLALLIFLATLSLLTLAHADDIAFTSTGSPSFFMSPNQRVEAVSMLQPNTSVSSGALTSGFSAGGTRRSIGGYSTYIMGGVLFLFMCVLLLVILYARERKKQANV